MIKEKPYSYKLNNGKVIELSLEEFRYMTKYYSWRYNTTENIILTIIDYSYEQNVLIANTNLDRVPIFHDPCHYYYSGIVAFDPFVSNVICLDDEEYRSKWNIQALSCIGHTFTIPTNTGHYWRKYKGEDIIDYVPSYDDIIDTSWDGRIAK